MPYNLLERIFIFTASLLLWHLDSQNIMSWKGPTRIIKSNPRLHKGLTCRQAQSERLLLLFTQLLSARPGAASVGAASCSCLVSSQGASLAPSACCARLLLSLEAEQFLDLACVVSGGQK